MNENQSEILNSNKKPYEKFFKSLVLTHKIQENLKKLNYQINLKLDSINSNVYTDQVEESNVYEQKPFILQYIEHQNTLNKNQQNQRNTSKNNRIKQYSTRKRKKLSLEVKSTEYPLAIVPKTGAVNRIIPKDDNRENNQIKVNVESLDNEKTNILEEHTQNTRIQFSDIHIQDHLKIVGCRQNKQSEHQRNSLGVDQSQLPTKTSRQVSQKKKLHSIDENIVNEYQDGDFITSGIEGKKKFDYDLLKCNREEEKTLKKRCPVPVSEKSPFCLNTTNKCCLFGTRNPFIPWFSLDTLVMEYGRRSQNGPLLLKRKRCRSVDMDRRHIYQYPLKYEKNLHSSLLNLKYQMNDELILIQNYTSLFDEVCSQRKQVLVIEDKNTIMYEEKNCGKYYPKDDCFLNRFQQEIDLENNFQQKSIENVLSSYKRINQLHFNPEIFYLQLSLLPDQSIQLNSYDISLLVEQSKLQWIKTTTDENNSSINWTKLIHKLPSNIEVDFMYIGGNQKHRKQPSNFKLIMNEIDRLTQDIETNQFKTLAFNLCRRGALYRKIGRLQEAKIDLTKAIEIEPNLSSAHWNIHFLHLIEGRIEDALYDLNQCEKCSSIINSVHKLFTDYNLTTDNHNSSVKICQKKVEQFYQNILYSKAFIYSILNDSKREIEIWTDLINCNPTNEKAYLQRAIVYQKLKMFHQANIDFTKILCLNPKSQEALFQCGLHQFYNNNWRQAIDYFQEVIINKPTHFEAHYFMAISLIKLYQYDRCLAELTACLYYQPLHYKALFTRGCLLAKVCPLQSLRDLTMCICIGNRKYRTLAIIYRGLKFYEMKQYTLAIHDFQTAIHDGCPQVLDVYRLLGLTYAQLKLWSRAIQTFTEGIKNQTMPEDTHLLLCRAEAYHSCGQYEKAIMDIQRVIHLKPNVAQYYLLLGHNLSQLSHIQLVQRFVQHYLNLSQIQNKNNNHEHVKQIALSYYYLGKYNDADSVLSKSQTKHKSVQLDYVLLHALVLDKLQRTNESVNLLENTLKKSAYLYRAQSKLRWIISQVEEASNLSMNQSACYHDEEVLNDISQALVLITTKTSPFYETNFYGPLKFINLLDQCLLTRIVYFALHKRYTKAILNCNEAIQQSPKWTRIWIYRGVFKYILRTYNFCEADLNYAIEKNETCSLAYYNRGLCHQTQANWIKAIQDYGSAIEYASLHGLVRFLSLINRSILYIEKYRNYEAALNDLYQAEIILNNTTYIHYNHEMNEVLPVDRNLNKNKINLHIKLMHTIGICHQRLEQYAKAEQIFHKLTLKEPGFLQGHIGHANCLMEYGGYMIKMKLSGSKKLWEQALTEYEYASKLDEFNLEASIGLSMCLQVLGCLNDALKHITNSLNNHYDQIELNCSETIIIDSKYFSSNHITTLLADAYDCRAIIYLQLGQFQYAIDDLTIAIRLNRYSTKYLINRGVAHLRNHDIMSAMIDFKNAIQNDPENSLANYHLALIYLHHGQFEQAENAVNITLSGKCCLPLKYYQLESVRLDPSVWLLRGIIRLLKYEPNNNRRQSILYEALNDVYQAEQLIRLEYILI
ncbi:unnamed protein product [Heterobilharzia americana]|nr:unnamed protein product [Heterobilharzia americana]